MKNGMLILVLVLATSAGSASARQTTYAVPSRFDARIDFEVTDDSETLVALGDGPLIVVLCNTGHSDGQYSLATPTESQAIRAGDCKLLPNVQTLSVQPNPGRWQGNAHLRAR